ncbi:Uncharacterized protein dnl_05580 [Desulfonema limicola]|uniref:Uncharacterized protein n=1 Tax=Desulfonema limicola TaxID=45656 RepID=A0A975B3X2_9BACT|nr:hypothetical protein [Desulfonema limicola]QTA78337.1 Uncharacterized protein dnl_05580 [Desulfonema limicola]
MKKIHGFAINQIYAVIPIIFVLICFQLPCTAASLPDIGMITMVKGEIIYWNNNVNEKKQAAQGFMKVRPDDEFRLAADSELQLIFFANGRKEIWKGPAELKLSEAMGQLADKNEKNDKLTVVQIPTKVVNEVRRISPLIDPAKLHRSGSYAIRGYQVEKLPVEKLSLKSASLDIEEREELDSVKQTYDALSLSSASNDITPELYLFSILADYEQFEDIKQILVKMKKKQPGNPGIEQLEDWLRNQALKQKG